MEFDFSLNIGLLVAHLFAYFFILFIFLKIRRKLIDRKLINSVTSFDRGTNSERSLILGLLKSGVPADCIFHDLYVRKPNGKYSQIDLVIVTNVGIIVVEIKDYSGWIFGTSNQTNWTQVLAYGKRKYRFYNPIKQNVNHIDALKQKLKQPNNIPFFSLIVFYGDCELKKIDYVPRNTYVVSAHRVFDALDIISNENDSINYSNEIEMLNILKQSVNLGEEPEVINKHLNDIEDMLGTNRVLK
tara:strand:- start:22 stop:750 length:729 start_codon:yes stop_codon:yes gene_type:complete